MPEKQTTLLYIDDERNILKMVGDFFHDFGFSVHLAENGDKGLKAFRDCNPDIVLVDIKMPGMDGFEVLETLSREAPDIPVIVVSGEGEMTDVIKALRLGAANYQTKPIANMDLFKHAVDQALEKAALVKQNKAYQKGLEKKLVNIIENFPGFIFTCDQACRITYMNPALTKYLGKEALGQKCHESLFGFQKKCPWCDDSFLFEGQRARQEILNPRNKRWYHVIHSPVLDQQGNVNEIQVILYDITERKQAELSLKEREEHLRKENIRLRSTWTDRYKLGNIIGKSRAMQEVYDTILSAAASDASVIIYGESGTGKELVAKAIHEHSDRKENKLVYVNCGAIPDNLLESEFFGYKQGAFTGATKDKPGFLDISDRGAIFLDEIAELPISMQVSLLRAIEGYGYTPVGGTEVKKPDVRIIAATNRDLTDEVKQGRMRQDFLYRIHIVPIQIPPLRERKEDIPLLVEHFLGSYDKETVPPLSPKITEALQKYNWPGNVRELQNTLNRFVILKKLDFMGLDLSDQGSGENINGINCDLQDKPLSVLLEEIEKQILLHALGKNTFHLGKTAEALQIDRKTLYRKMKHFNIDRPPSK